ncbi:MAG: DUF2478 domain-containing protein [Primorskyibacter sp.]
MLGILDPSTLTTTPTPILRAVVHRLTTHGVRVVGALETRAPVSPDTNHPHMELEVLGHPQPIRISQTLGSQATGCRLDSAGLEQAVGLVSAQMDDIPFGSPPIAQVVIVNKFGKQEAAGRGFRTVIAQAIGADIPVLVCVSPAYRAAFDAFAGGLGTPLALDDVTIHDWVMAQLWSAQTT